ncbi:SusC/RagA family TonB-linked outer membrane protein [Galbibacter sp.]|uniref:SusC/RagA family TonB-linked outer membrane protein n=1 Tax=Galbibacter sp. TaxID=2918471 RepID=UPI003A8ED3CA
MQNKHILRDRCILLVLLLIFSIGTYSLFGNNKTINFLELADYQHRVKGQVTDSNGIPIPGVNVEIKGTSYGNFTDKEGYFYVDAAPTDVLILSYIGFKQLEVTVGTSEELSLVLEEDITTLEAVTVNAGYYTVSERARTGSIAKVTAEEIELQPIVSPLEALQGRMAGVQIDQFSGMPGAAPKIRIRGTNSLRDDGNYPLYIVDGVPINSEPLDDYTALGGHSNLINPGIGIDPLSTLNLSDIESIEVLKDADATAIYGSRGANGVVLITTKKAGMYEQKTQVQARWYSGIGQVERREKLLNSEQYVAFRKAHLNNSGFGVDHPLYFHFARDLLNWDNSRYTDWQDELIGGTAEFSNLNISASGGNGNTSFRLTGGYSDQGTVFPLDIGYKKLTFGVKINHISDNKKWKLQFSGNYGIDKTQSTPTADIMNAIYYPPIAPKLYNDDHTLHWEEWEKMGSSTIYNPIRSKYKMTEGKVSNSISNLTISYNILKELTFKASIGYTTNRRDAVSKQSLLFFAPSQRGVGINQTATSIDYAERTSWIVEPQISYETNIFHGELDILIGSTFQNNQHTSSNIYGRGFVDESLSGDISSADFRLGLGGKVEEYKYQAIFGRIGYNWKQKYYINLTGRRDGSSRFGPGKRFSNFGAVGAAWIFSEELMFKERIPWLSFAKFRGSYGVTGSDQIGDYQYIDSYQATTAPGGLYPTQLYNDNFAWEKNKKLEASLELGFLQDRIHMGFSWYRNRSSNQLVGYTLPLMTGFSSVQSNLPATVQNTGWEVEFSTTPITSKDFRWDIFFNLSLPKNELLNFPNIELTPYANQYRVGHPLNIALLFEYIGKNEAGQFEFTDVDKNGILDIKDRIYVQNRSRKYFGGLRNSLSYKQWKLDIQLDFVKRQAQRPTALYYPLPGSTTRNYPLEQYEMWKDRELNPDNTDSSQYRHYIYSGYNIVDGSYLRLKNLSLVYSMPESWIRPLGISGWNVFFTAQNLLTLTSYPGLNVESGGVATLPPLRMFSTGLQLTF